MANAVLCECLIIDGDSFFIEVLPSTTFDEFMMLIYSQCEDEIISVHEGMNIQITSTLILQEIMAQYRIGSPRICNLQIQIAPQNNLYNMYSDYNFNDNNLPINPEQDNSVQFEYGKKTLTISNMKITVLNGIWRQIITDYTSDVFVSPDSCPTRYYIFQGKDKCWYMDISICGTLNYPFGKSEFIYGDWRFREWSISPADILITADCIEINLTTKDINGTYVRQPDTNNINGRRTYNQLKGEHILFSDGTCWKIGKGSLEEDDIIIKSQTNEINNIWLIRKYEIDYMANCKLNTIHNYGSGHIANDFGDHRYFNDSNIEEPSEDEEEEEEEINDNKPVLRYGTKTVHMSCAKDNDLNGVWKEVMIDGFKGDIYRVPEPYSTLYYFYQRCDGIWVIDSKIDKEITYPYAKYYSLTNEWWFIKWTSVDITLGFSGNIIEVKSSMNELSGTYYKKTGTNNPTYIRKQGLYKLIEDKDDKCWKITKKQDENDIIVKSKTEEEYGIWLRKSYTILPVCSVFKE